MPVPSPDNPVPVYSSSSSFQSTLHNYSLGSGRLLLARARGEAKQTAFMTSGQSGLAMAAQREAKVPGVGDAGRRRARHVAAAALEMGGADQRAEHEEEEKGMMTRACWAATAAIAGVGLAGAGVLVWWAVAFQPTHRQLWMVPVGLVLLGTPLIAWLSLFASGTCRWLGRIRAGATDQGPAVAPESAAAD